MSAKKVQGLINQYRKSFLVINIAIFSYLWFFTKGFPVIPEPYFDLIEGFAVIIMFIGVLGRVFSSLTIGGKKNQQVIDTEIYSVVRHPLYFFSFLMTLGASLLIGRLDLIIYMIFIFIICFFPMMINEQKFLERKFGDEYIKYKNKTPFFIPNFSLYKARDEILFNHRLVTKTIFDAFFGLLIIPTIEIIEFIKTILS